MSMLTEENIIKRIRNHRKDQMQLSSLKDSLDLICSDSSSSIEEKQAAQILIKKLKKDMTTIGEKISKIRNALPFSKQNMKEVFE